MKMFGGVLGGYSSSGNNDQFEFRYTNYTNRGDRTRDSACAFAEGMWGSCGEWHCDVGHILVLNFHFAERRIDKP